MRFRGYLIFDFSILLFTHIPRAIFLASSLRREVLALTSQIFLYLIVFVCDFSAFLFVLWLNTFQIAFSLFFNSPLFPFS